MLAGVGYERIDDRGLAITQGGESRLLEVDHIVVCAGQEPRRDLAAGIEAAGYQVRLIGGSHVATELDAKRAIDEGSRLAAAL